MTCNKVCLVDQISRLDRLLTKTKVRHGHTAGLLGVIVKVCLCIHIGVVADDLDGVLVCTYGTVSTKSPEFAVDGSFRRGNKGSTQFQRKVCHIIHDTDGEFCLLIIMVYGNDLRRCSIFGTKSVTSCKYRNIVKLRTFQSCNYIQVKGFAHCTRLFCSVKNSDLLYAVRNSSNQCFCTERSVKTYLYDTYFFACCHEVIDGFFNGIAYRTHSYDNLFSISCAIVVEELVVGTDLSIYFIHVFLYDSRHCIVEGVTCFTCLEEDIRVLS